MEAGENGIQAMEILNYKQKDRDNIYFVLFGGDDDTPDLELWDPLNNQKLAFFENAHEYGISSMKLIQ